MPVFVLLAHYTLSTETNLVYWFSSSRARLVSWWGCHILVAFYPKQLRFLLGSCGALDCFLKFSLGRLVIKTNMMKRWNHNVIVLRGISHGGAKPPLKGLIKDVQCCSGKIQYGGPFTIFSSPSTTNSAL